MQISIEEKQNTTTLCIDFLDEGVDLQCETSVKGDASSAIAYLSFFERDMRRNFADEFPEVPEAPEAPEGGFEI